MSRYSVCLLMESAIFPLSLCVRIRELGEEVKREFE